MDQLALKRAEKEQDCRLCSPFDILEELIADIKAGKYKPNKLVLIFSEPLPNDGDRVSERYAGVTRSEIIALLEYQKSIVLEDWKR